MGMGGAWFDFGCELNRLSTHTRTHKRARASASQSLSFTKEEEPPPPTHQGLGQSLASSHLGFMSIRLRDVGIIQRWGPAVPFISQQSSRLSRVPATPGVDMLERRKGEAGYQRST